MRFAVFAGGYLSSGDMSNTVDSYDENLIRTVQNSLLNNVRGNGGAYVGDYIIFAGGSYVDYTSISTILTDTAEAYVIA